MTKDSKNKTHEAQSRINFIRP